MIGSRLAHYEITAHLGSGGFGEVYQASDSKLGRSVAIKFLPEAFGHDSERVARFEREARVLASLNHPNIAAIYGLEESDEHKFLVMELVEGETLAEQIKRGPIPVDESLTIAQQICEALEAAHEKGIIHRDLKPANVKITPEGRVKVLDFGLAKAYAPDGANADLSNSPTLSAAATNAGVILGTAAYMAPEQAKGKTVDRLADIWAFGVVLYEMLTGKQLFHGENVTEILAGVLKGEPDWQALPAETPQSVRVLLRRCLQKDAKQRFRDAGDIRIQIEEAHTIPIATAPTAAAPVPHRVLWRWITLTVLACLLSGGIIGLTVWKMKPAQPRPVSRTVVSLPSGQRLDGLNKPVLALSPDGTQLAYVASDSAGTERLYVRPIDSLEARLLAGTEGASAPFFSPDGQWIGFFAPGKLKKVQISGGGALTLGDVGGNPMGASWGPDDSIVVAPVSAAGLGMVSAAGGAWHPLTTLKGETSHRWPEFLPGGNAILFTVTRGGAPDDSQIDVQRLDTGERKVLIRGGTFGRYVPPGHLVYYRAGTVMAVPFALAQLAVTGPPAPVLEGVMSSTQNSGAGEFSFSNSGSLVYLPGGPRENEVSMAWVDRKGTAQFLPAPPRAYSGPRLSPDGHLAAVTIGNDVWVYDLARGTSTRLTYEGRNAAPNWTPDGKRVFYSSTRTGANSIFWKLADGSGPEELLITSVFPRGGSITPDGRTLLFLDSTDPKTGTDLWALPLEGERKPHIFLQTPFSEVAPRHSPDGRWVAYVSNESGRNEIYVRPFPGPGGKWQISTEGGQGIAWSLKGNELFYRTGPQNAKMMVVDVQTQPTFSAGKPRLLFEAPQAAVLPFGGTGPDYSVSADGQRFLMVRPREQAQASLTQINVVMNWFEELKRRVPLR